MGCHGQETRIYLSLIERMAGAASYNPNFTIITQPMEKRNMQRLKDAGVDCVAFDMEVWDAEMFAEVCPGKAGHIGRGRYLEAFLEAVDVFGAGNVECLFVGGITLLAANGHNTWQEAWNSQVEGIRWMIKNGVNGTIIPARWAPGSVYSQDPANRAKLPPIEFVLEVALAHHEAMTEYGLYEKLNKFMACPLECSAPYVGEIGILALAGDVGTWMSDVVPDKANWMAKFISSVKPAA